MGGMTAGHFIFIPAVLLFGLVIGWILGSRAAADAYAAELKRREERASRQEGKSAGRRSKGVERGANRAPGMLVVGAIALASLGCGSDIAGPADGPVVTSDDTVEVRRRLFDLEPVVIEALMAGDEEDTTVVLLAGSGLGAVRFLNFLPRLAAAGLRPVALNPRGVEASVGPLRNITLHDLAEDVAGVIEGLTVGPVYVLGHGFGNRVARCLAADRPDLVAGLVLLGAGGQVPGDPQAMEAMARLYEPGLTEEDTVSVLQTAFFAPTSDASVWADLSVFPDVRRAQGEANRETRNEDWLFAGTTTPILIIQGRHDRIAPPENGRWLRERLGERVRLVELANSGHALLPEQPAEIVDAIVDFIDRSP